MWQLLGNTNKYFREAQNYEKIVIIALNAIKFDI